MLDDTTATEPITDTEPPEQDAAIDASQAPDAVDAQGQPNDAETSEKGASGDETKKLRKEAATHRTRAKAAEQESARLAAVVAEMQRNEVERLAAVTLAEPGDLWLTGLQLDALLRDADGGLDPAKVTAAVDRIAAERPHWRRAAPAANFDAGYRGTTVLPSPSFGAMLKNRSKGG